MRGAFGKAHGTVARVRIGQILISVRSTDKHKVSVFFGILLNNVKEESEEVLNFSGESLLLKNKIPEKISQITDYTGLE